MPITIGRWSRLAALGVGLATAAAVAISGASPALAGTADGTGTATITLSTTFLTHLAKHGIVVIAESPATSSDTSGADAFTFPVTGGNGTNTNFTGSVTLGGALTFIDGSTGQTVQLTSLALNYFTGDLTAIPAGTTKTINVADLAGTLTTDNQAGPPTTETTSSSQLDLDNWGATYLNNHLKADLHHTPGPFVTGHNVGIHATAFTATYDATYS